MMTGNFLPTALSMCFKMVFTRDCRMVSVDHSIFDPSVGTVGTFIFQGFDKDFLVISFVDQLHIWDKVR